MTGCHIIYDGAITHAVGVYPNNRSGAADRTRSRRRREAYDSSTVGGTLYQGLLVYADGRFVADLEAGRGVVRALRMARSEAAGGAGWRDLIGKLVFPCPVVLSGSNAPRDSRGGPPATTVAVPVANLRAAGGAAAAGGCVPVPLLRGVAAELEVVPDAVFGRACAAFAVADRILGEAGFDGDLVRVTGHCRATLAVLSDDARTMERSVGSCRAAGRRPGGAGALQRGRHAGGAGAPAARRAEGRGGVVAGGARRDDTHGERGGR